MTKNCTSSYDIYLMSCVLIVWVAVSLATGLLKPRHITGIVSFMCCMLHRPFAAVQILEIECPELG
jgi:hypothetical protein